MLEYAFMQRAFIAGVLIAILAAVSGTFVVLKRYSLIGETLSHASLVGVAVAIVAEQRPLYVATIFALVAAWAIEYLRTRFSLYSDSVLSIILSGSLALAIIIVSLGGAFNASLFAYLFGSILTVSDTDVLTISVVGTITLLALLYFAPRLYFIAFDEEVAQVSGIKVQALNFLLISVVAVIISLSIRVVGTLLIGALMIIPVSAALQFRLGFLKTMALATLFAVLGVILGMALSYHFSIPSGATIVLVTIAIFIFSLIVKRQ